MTMRLSPLNHRWQLADLVKFSSAVEVGTHRGEFAAQLCHVRSNHPSDFKLWCVDPWLPYFGDEHLAEKGATREEDLNAAARKLRPFILEDRCELLRTTSLTAAKQLFPDKSLDLAYLDGDHRYAHVLQDCMVWWPKVRPGGLLAGHDIVTPGETCNDGVQEAVLKLARAWQVDIQLIPENSIATAGFAWSWYMEKPK